MVARVVLLFVGLLCALTRATIVHHVVHGAEGEIVVKFDTTSGDYSVSVDNEDWLTSENIAFHVDGKWYNSKDSTLVLKSSSNTKGTSTFLGQYIATSIEWNAGSVPVITTIKSYQTVPAIVFEVSYPVGAVNTSLNTNTDVITNFPMFSKFSSSLNYLTFQGLFANPVVGKMQAGHMPGGIEGGPVFLYNEKLRTVALSPLDNFMVSIHEWVESGSLSFGIQGKVKELPYGFTSSTVLYGGQGIRSTVSGWGAMLLGVYGKKPATLASDEIISKLGYWTDDGGYYWYNTEPGKNYQETVIDVMNYLKSANIPVKNFQLDSWWYPKGKNGGVLEWVPMSTVFPDGIKYVHDQIGVPLAMHNRYFAPDTPYQKNFSMIVEDYCALPQDENLFLSIMGASKSWGNVVYEQDWLITTYEKMNATQDNVVAGRKWLVSMGAAAAKLNMTIQYCMPLPLHLLQSVEAQPVTQTRVSGDYVPGTDQWKAGWSGMLAWALGLVPYKDDFWTTESQPNCYNMDGRGTHCTEPNTILQTLSAALTAGPVGPSDMIGKMNRTLIMHTCRNDGLLLKADYPAIPLDAFFRNTFATPRVDQIWLSSTTISSYTFHYLLAAGLPSPFTLQVSDLPGAGNQSNYVAIDYFSLLNKIAGQTAVATLDNAHDLVVPVAGLPNIGQEPFRYYVLAPQTAKCVLMGEVNKFITVSKQRVKSITVTSLGMSVAVMGSPGESLQFGFIKDVSNPSLTVASVILDQQGLGSVSCN